MASNKMIAFLIAIVCILIVIVIGVGWNSQRNSQHIDQISGDVHELKVFVDELKETTPDEQAQNAAVSAAVALVPEIRVKQTEIIEILCQAFPEASACQSGG